MRAKIILIICALAVLFSIALAVEYSELEPHGSILPHLTEEQFNKCGLNKLSQDELEQLAEVIDNQLYLADFTNAGFDYLKESGWQILTVTGYETLTPRNSVVEDEFLLVIKDDTTHTLDPSIPAERLVPGYYWVKPGGMRWQIIGPDGKVSDFYEK